MGACRTSYRSWRYHNAVSTPSNILLHFGFSQNRPNPAMSHSSMSMYQFWLAYVHLLIGN